MSDTPDSAAPGVLRQEGPHRVKVAPGSHSALAPSVGVGTKRLRPAIGAAPVPTPVDEGSGLSSSSLRQRQGTGASTTEVQRRAGPAAVHGRFAPGSDPSGSRVRPAEPSALEQRLAALADLNSKTSRSVTAFEGEVAALSGPTRAPTDAADPDTIGAPASGLRALFKRRSS